MKIGVVLLKKIILLFLLATLVFGRQPALAQQILKNKRAVKPASERFVSIDFNNVDIRVFIKFISELVGKNFIIDHRVKGKVTIISPSKISIKEAYKVFESVLEVHGYATVKAGKVIKIIPSPEARTKSIETRLKDESILSEDKVITQIIP